MDTDGKKQAGESWYKPALMFYAKTTSWILGPVAVAFLVKHFTHASNAVFFIILAVCFAATIYGIYKEIKIYRNNFETTNDK